MERRKFTDSRLAMTPVVILQRLPADFDEMSSWRKLPSERLIAQSSCTSVPMSLPFYRRRRQPIASLPEEQSNITQRKKAPKATRRTKRISHSAPAKKLAKKHVMKQSSVTVQGSENGTAAAERVPESKVQEEPNVCDIEQQNKCNFMNSDNEETTSTTEQSASPADTLVLTEHSGHLSVSGSDTEIDEGAVYDTSLSHDSNDTITVTVPAELLTDLETDTDAECRNSGLDADSSQYHSQESSQSTVLSESEKQGPVKGQSLHSGDDGKKGCVTNVDHMRFHSAESDTKTSDSTVRHNLHVDSASPEPAVAAPPTTCGKQISAEDEIDAFTANIIETMLDVHVSSLPTFAKEYFHHFKVCLEVLSSMREADKNMYVMVLRRKRDSLKRIFQLFKELQHLVDYSSLESILMLERQFCNFVNAVEVREVRDVAERGYRNNSSKGFGCGDVQQSAIVSDCLQAQSQESRGAVPSSTAGCTSTVTSFSSTRHIPQSTAQSRRDSPILNRSLSYATQSPFPPGFSLHSESPGQDIVQSSSLAARSRATRSNHDVQSMQSTDVCSVNQRQQPQPTSTEQSISSCATLHASTKSSSQSSSQQPQTSSSLAGSCHRPFTLVVRGVNSLSQAHEAARKIVLNQINCATRTAASESLLCPQKQAGLPQCSSPAMRTHSSPASSTTHMLPKACPRTNNVLCQAKSATDLASNPSSTFASVPMAPIPQGVPLQAQGQPTPVPVQTFSIQQRAPVALNGASPVVPPLRWTSQGLLLVSSRGQTTNCSTGFMSSAGSPLPTNLGQSCIRNSWPRPNISNFALVLPPLGTVNQRVRSSVINIQAPVTVMPAGQAVMHSVGSAAQLQNRSVPVGGFNSGPPAASMSQPRPCITGVVIPVVRSKLEGNMAQNNVICTVQDTRNSPNLVQQRNVQNTKPPSVASCSPTTPHLATGPSR